MRGVAVLRVGAVEERESLRKRVRELLAVALHYQARIRAGQSDHSPNSRAASTCEKIVARSLQLLRSMRDEEDTL